MNKLVLASRILEAMDSTVDPCDDFFSYACGEWNRNHIIPDDMSSYNTFVKLREDLQSMLKGLNKYELLFSVNYVKNMYHIIYSNQKYEIIA